MRRVVHRSTTRVDGDFAVPAPGVEPDPALLSRRARLAPGPWTWLRQVHGADVVTVTRPGEHAGVEADAAVTTVSGAVLSVTTADCAPVVLVGAGGSPGAGDRVLGVVHAGWRGLAAGILAATAEAMGALGAVPNRAVVGPSICPRCYEFGPADLDAVAARLGPSVRSTARSGAPALDLVAGVRAALAALGIDEAEGPGACTSCSPELYSHRARGETGRLATVAWIEADAPR